MLINGHAHVFTLHTVLSKEAIEIMVARLRRFLKHQFIADAVADFLNEQLDHPEYLVEDELLVRFMKHISDQAGFKNVLGELPVEVRNIGDPTKELGVKLAEAALNKLSGWIDAQDGPGKSPYDIFQTLRIAMQPDIPRVAGKLLHHLGPDDAIVALMMDIVGAKEPDRDRKNFRKQIRGTLDAALAYPGRVLPFIAVNSGRSDHFDVMRRAIEDQGFVGVKLYPSLGYEMTTAEMDAVLGYCSDKDVPITIHTSAGGFNKDDVTAQYCHPKHWTALLKKYPELRVCFAHCGGWGGLCNHIQDQAEWAREIFGHMQYTGVYADISYHVDFMYAGAAIEQKYLDALIALIDDPDRGDRIVWGTDSWLLRLNMDDDAYWRYFRKNLGDERMEKIAGANARRFLGLPDAGGNGARANVVRHVDWLEEHAKEVGALPAAWVRSMSDVTWSVVRRNADWNVNNKAHWCTFKYLHPYIKNKSIRFEDAGPLRMRQLTWFAQSGSKPKKDVLTAQALNLMKTVDVSKGAPEKDYDLKEIEKRLMRLLADGNLTLSELGSSIDAMYLFPSEVDA